MAYAPSPMGRKVKSMLGIKGDFKPGALLRRMQELNAEAELDPQRVKKIIKIHEENDTKNQTRQNSRKETRKD